MDEYQRNKCAFAKDRHGVPICNVHFTQLVKQGLTGPGNPPPGTPGHLSPWFCEKGQTTVYEPAF